MILTASVSHSQSVTATPMKPWFAAEKCENIVVCSLYMHGRTRRSLFSHQKMLEVGGPPIAEKLKSDPSLDSNPKTPIVLPLPSEEELNTFYNNLSKAGKALPYYLLFRALVMIMYKITVIIPPHCQFCMIPVVWQ